jgi:hypothetical protein
MAEVDFTQLFRDADREDDGFTNTVSSRLSKRRQRRVFLVSLLASGAAVFLFVLAAGFAQLASLWIGTLPADTASDIASSGPLAVFLIAALFAVVTDRLQD